jgi:hypothetical protein
LERVKNMFQQKRKKKNYVKTIYWGERGGGGWGPEWKSITGLNMEQSANFHNFPSRALKSSSN